MKIPRQKEEMLVWQSERSYTCICNEFMKGIMIIRFFENTLPSCYNHISTLKRSPKVRTIDSVGRRGRGCVSDHTPLTVFKSRIQISEAIIHIGLESIGMQSSCLSSSARYLYVYMFKGQIRIVPESINPSYSTWRCIRY